jgi:hypothetical protein
MTSPEIPVFRKSAVPQGRLAVLLPHSAASYDMNFIARGLASPGRNAEKRPDGTHRYDVE